MIQTIVAVLMWLLVACLLILRRGRSDRSIIYAAGTIAVAMTLNIDGAYRAIDRVLGATNISTLLADLALMIGIFFLGRGVARATEYTSPVIRVALGRPILAVALASTVIAFALIDRGDTSASFMLDLGEQPAAAAYSIIQFSYDGIVLTAMGVLSARQIPRTDGMQRLPSVSLLIGSVLGVAFCLVIVVMDVAHLTGNLTLMFGVGTAYGPLYLLTFVFLCLGLAGQPAIRLALSRSRERRTSELQRELAPVWHRANRARPGLSQRDLEAFQGEDDESQLHRQVVEIRDAMVDPRVSFELNEGERTLVDAAEAHLLGRAQVAARSEGGASVRSPKEAH